MGLSSSCTWKDPGFRYCEDSVRTIRHPYPDELPRDQTGRVGWRGTVMAATTITTTASSDPCPTIIICHKCVCSKRQGILRGAAPCQPRTTGKATKLFQQKFLNRQGVALGRSGALCTRQPRHNDTEYYVERAPRSQTDCKRAHGGCGERPNRPYNPDIHLDDNFHQKLNILAREHTTGTAGV